MSEAIQGDRVLHEDHVPAAEPQQDARAVETAAVLEQNAIQPKVGYDAVKRIFDIVVAALCMTVGLPVYLVIALLIVANDFGNPLFVQPRVGKDGRVFRMVKFRSMYVNSDREKTKLMQHNEYDGVHFKMENDPRITRVGRMLRRTSLDEIPQALNLLTGSMTVVGPRPFVPAEQAQLPSDRLAVKPGLSCYWQLADTTKMTDAEQLELDYRYIRERSVKTDLKIIKDTIKSMAGRENC